MQWTSVGEFLAMGGYALYVWPTFGLAAAVLAGLWLDSRARLAAAQRDLAAAEQLRETARDA